MTLTSDQLKTVIVELGAPENHILDTKITRLACLGAEIYIVQFRGRPYLKGPPKYYYSKKYRMATEIILISGP